MSTSAPAAETAAAPDLRGGMIQVVIATLASTVGFWAWMAIAPLQNIYGETMGLDQIVDVIGSLEKQMKEASKALDFERAAQLRDEIAELRKFVNPGDFVIPKASKSSTGSKQRAR